MSVFNKLKRLFDIREHFLLDCIVITIHIKYKQRLLRLTLSSIILGKINQTSHLIFSHFSGQVWSHVQEAEREG